MKRLAESMETYVQKRVHEMRKDSLTSSEIYDIIMKERPEETYEDVLFSCAVANVLELKLKGL